MYKLFTKARLAVTAVLAVSTLSMTLLVSAPNAEAVNCSQLKTNSLFKVSGFSAVYLVNTDGRRLYFPNEEVYRTWFSDFSNIITIDQSCIDNYPSGGGVNYRPGSRLVKTAISPSVFLIEPNNTKRKIANEQIAQALYGPKWNLFVRNISDATDSNYQVGSEVKTLSLLDGADGLIVVQADLDFPDYYFVDNGVLRKIVGTLPAPLSGDVHIISSSLFQTASISNQTITPAEILADPSQGGVVIGGQNPVLVPVPTSTSTEPTTPVNPQTLETGGNFVDVYSCKQVGKNIEIKRTANDAPTTLTSSCRDAGNGLREYTMSCGSNNRYYVSWKPCSGTPVQSSSQTDLISKFWVNEDLSTDRLMTEVSYGSGAGYPWSPKEANIAQNVNTLHLIVTPKVTGNLTYGFIWSDNGTAKVDFTDAMTKNSAKLVNFNSSPKNSIQLTDYYRGKWVFIQVFVRNNDGISGVPGMPVEVDDIAVARVYVPAKTAVNPSVNQTDLLLKLSVTENNSEVGYSNYVSYGSGFNYPWNPDDASISQNVEKLKLVLTPKVSGGLTYGFVWVENGSVKVDFTDARTREMAKITSFSSSPTQTFTVTDYYRGKWVLLYAFARNNDGVSGIPGMPVEVDDVIVTRFFVPAKTTAPVVTGPNLSLTPSFVAPTTNQVLTAYPRVAEISIVPLTGARHYEVEIYCDYCGSSKWSSAAYKFSALQPESGYAKVTTFALPGDNEFRARTRAVYVDKVTGDNLYGTWSEYRYFSFKTSAAVTPPPATVATSTTEISLANLIGMQPSKINFEDAIGPVITKYTSAYGVTIWSNKGTAIFTSSANRGGEYTSSGEYSLFNNATSPNTSANDPLIIGFNTPVKAFGFFLGGGNKYGQQVSPIITVYGEYNAVIGVFQKNNIPSAVTTYLGVKSNKPIHRVTIDYGDTLLGEEIDDLMLVR